MILDIVSDTICPWCYIGKTRFEQARAERPQVDFDISWRPFQLNPDMPREGMGRDEYLAAKFGGRDRAKSVYRQVEEAAEATGLTLRFDLIRRTPNTLDSHRVVRWAKTAGVQDAVVTALFRAYFEQGEDIADRDVLTLIAGSAGMDTALVSDLLSRDDDRDLVAKEDTLAREIGVTGVPAFIFENRLMVPGAQDPAIFVQVFDQLSGTTGGDSGPGS